MEFSVVFWNIKTLGNNLNASEIFENRVETVANHIRELDPDLLCLCEINDKAVLRILLTEALRPYDFAATDTHKKMELVTGWKRNRFKQVILTQRRQFNVGSIHLRPGALATVNFKGAFFNFLFLHADSGTENKDYKNRQEIFRKVWDLKSTLDNISADNAARFVVMGDLNTMGTRNQESKEVIIPAETEIETLKNDAITNGMRMLPKTYENTWWGRPPHSTRLEESNLDHVLATDNIVFQPFKDDAIVRVSGWNELQGRGERSRFRRGISDHCAIVCKVIYQGIDNPT